MITAIVFSKDRPLQFSLCLSSIRKNLPWVTDITVISKCSSVEYNEAYVQVDKEHEFEWVLQGNLYEDIERAIRTSKNEYICFFTDDDIVFRKPINDFSLIDQLFKSMPLCTLSLRLGLNTNLRDYGDGVLQPDVLPMVSKVHGNLLESIFIWNRSTLPVGGYWGYPLSVDGHIFQKNIIYAILEEICSWRIGRTVLQPDTPNVFESVLQRFYFEISPIMSCLEKSCVVNTPNNRVQKEFENRAGDKFGYSPEYLLDLFNQGKRISLEKLNINNVCCPHQEFDLIKGIE